ncbi:fumarylacetoacetate hydrolase family protein [bacterium]|nr:fumarylacetoacetate hydrolase family protein [bacterium]
MKYKHTFLNGTPCDLPVGKAVCVARNYYDHIKELDNPVPTEPIFFIKPATAIQNLNQPIVIPDYSDNCHHETELAILFDKQLTRANAEEVNKAIAGFGIALDLTLRDVQQKLKEKGYPWEKAKAFDGSCPISPFIQKSELADPQNTQLKLIVNGETRQNESTKLMINKIIDLIVISSGYFSYMPGDVLLTGTPAGVSRLQSGDNLELELDGRHSFKTRVQ